MNTAISKDWVAGNDIALLENGEEYFPALFDAIAGAKREILLETYIWYEDEIGLELADRLVAAARRGAAVRATVDGYGSPRFSEPLLEKMSGAGIEIYAFDMQKPLFAWLRTNMLCRLHRKIVVIDDSIAFVGGINAWALHLRRYGDKSMQDYAVRVTGPVVAGIREAVLDCAGGRSSSTLRRLRRRLRRNRHPSRPGHGEASARFVTRDNRNHPNDIELAYREAIRAAKSEIWIACAYFFPGYRLLRDLARAAKRGVEVRLILQGRPDVAISAFAASALYDYLMAAGIRIFHYDERPLHAKVAVIDEEWTTVGSSNLDPISLGLNLEANLVALDRRFAATLRERLAALLETACSEVTVEVPRNRLWRRLLLLTLYHATRRMPRWGGLLLRRPQPVVAMKPAGSEQGVD